MSLINKLLIILRIKRFYFKHIKKYAQQNVLCPERSKMENDDNSRRHDSYFVYRKSTSLETADFHMNLNSTDDLIEFAQAHSMSKFTNKDLLFDLFRLHKLLSNEAEDKDVSSDMYVMF